LAQGRAAPVGVVIIQKTAPPFFSMHHQVRREARVDDRSSPSPPWLSGSVPPQFLDSLSTTMWEHLPWPTSEKSRSVAPAGRLECLPCGLSIAFDSYTSEEISTAVRTTTVGSMMKIVSPCRFGIGWRNRHRFVAVSYATGDVVWMRKPTLWANHDGEPDVSTFEAQLSRLPKNVYKRERLVGVIPEARQVSTCAECSFILALECKQLVLVASDLATKRAWVAACFSILEQKANAISLVADAAMTAAVMDAHAKSKAVELKAAADLKADLERGRDQLHAQITAYGGAGLDLLGEERTCVVCFEVCRGHDEGVECGGSEPHFMCNECMVASVRSSISDELSKQDLRGGRLACPLRTFPRTECSCDAPFYDDRIVAKKVDATTFTAYLQVRTKLVEAKLAREANAEMEHQIAAAIKRMEVDGPSVFQAQKYICDDILTMRCPRCRMAFADWDGCNALYCTYAGCGCNFCAFCLKDCGGGVKFGQNEIQRRGDDEVHKHVNECKYAQGIGHGNDGRVQSQVWNQIRKDRIEESLKTMCESVAQRQKVVDNLKKQFDDLGLVIVVPGLATTSSVSSAAASSVAAPAPVRNIPDDFALPENIKRCPACGIPIEKINGKEIMCRCEVFQ